MKTIRELTSESVFNWYHLNDDMSFEYTEIDSSKLIHRNRLDIMAKVLYLKLKDACPDYAKDLYLEHIRVMTKDSFIEPGSNKKGADAFIEAFLNTYNSMKENGYNEEMLPIPVDMNYQLMDGAHRVASAIVLNKPVWIIKLPVVAEYDCYDQNYFKERLMKESYLDEMVLEYIRRKKNVGCVNIWPSAKGHEQEVEDILNKEFGIIYRKDVILNENGAFHYLAQIYKEYSWAQNNDGDGFSGVYRKLVPCFPTFDPVKTYMIEVNDFSRVTEVKEQLRNLFQLEKHSMHATDTPQETIEMVSILLSEHTISFMNQCQSLKFKNTFALLESGKKYDMADTVFTGSIVLALYGIRQAEDLDFITTREDPVSHNDLLAYYGMTALEAINHPEFSFTYFGMKFLTLDCVKKFKKNRNEGKDEDDLKLIELVLKSNGKDSFKVRMMQIKRRAIAKMQGFVLRAAHATGTYDLLRNIYKKLKGKKQ